MKRGEIILLWVAGLWTAFSLASGKWLVCSFRYTPSCFTSLKPLAWAIAGSVIVFLVWVTIYRRPKTTQEEPKVLEPQILIEGVRRICVILSGLILLSAMTLAGFALHEGRHMKKFGHISGENAPNYGDAKYDIYMEYRHAVIERVYKGYLTEEEGIKKLDDFVNPSDSDIDIDLIQAIKWARMKVPQVKKVIVPLWQRIDWAWVFKVSVLSALVIALPWMLYGIGIYIAKGFKKLPS